MAALNVEGGITHNAWRQLLKDKMLFKTYCLLVPNRFVIAVTL